MNIRPETSSGAKPLAFDKRKQGKRIKKRGALNIPSAHAASALTVTRTRL
jgi:hypothetical protein